MWRETESGRHAGVIREWREYFLDNKQKIAVYSPSSLVA